MSTYKMSKEDAIRVSGSSRGSQIKFCKDNYWYKIDEAGPEGMAEALASIVLKHSSLDKSDYITYEMCDIEYGGRIYKGCRSEDFLKENEQFVSYAKIYELTTGRELSEDIIPRSGPEERIRYVCDMVKDFAGIDPYEHIAKTATVDMVILNTDRHFHNIGIITDLNYENARNAPIFDNGAAFLSNFTRNPPDLKVEDIDIHSNVFGRPFAPDLEYQAVCAGLSVSFDFEGIKEELSLFPDIENSRPGQILLHQIELCKDVPELVICQTKEIEPVCRDNRFIMVSGIPGAGKTDVCRDEIDKMIINGIAECKASDILPIDKLPAKSILTADKGEIKNIFKDMCETKEDSVVYISAAETREEVKEFGVSDDRLTFAIIDARIEVALEKGYNVVYDATNLDKETRDKYVDIAINSKVEHTELILCHCSTEKSGFIHPEIRKDVIEEMKARFEKANLVKDDRWNIVKDIGLKTKEMYRDEQIIER